MVRVEKNREKLRKNTTNNAAQAKIKVLTQPDLDTPEHLVIDSANNRALILDFGLGLWSDVEPLPQYEGGAAPIAAIHYSSQCKFHNFLGKYLIVEETMGYFRALFHKREISMRAYELTKEVIMMNAGNYSAWHYRRLLLDELKLPLKDEIEFLDEI